MRSPPIFVNILFGVSTRSGCRRHSILVGSFQQREEARLLPLFCSWVVLRRLRSSLPHPPTGIEVTVASSAPLPSCRSLSRCPGPEPLSLCTCPCPCQAPDPALSTPSPAPAWGLLEALWGPRKGAAFLLTLSQQTGHLRPRCRTLPIVLGAQAGPVGPREDVTGGGSRWPCTVGSRRARKGLHLVSASGRRARWAPSVVCAAGGGAGGAGPGLEVVVMWTLWGQHQEPGSPGRCLLSSSIDELCFAVSGHSVRPVD